MNQPTYFYKGDSQGGRGHYYVHPWVYNHYFDFGYGNYMNNLPFTNVSGNDMYDLFGNTNSNKYLSNLSTTKNDQLQTIDPDLNTFSNNIKQQCQNFDTSLDFRYKCRYKTIYHFSIQIYVA